ncbi:MAG: TAXI family TRAP transporter solute-binding subunit [Steroidobacteraceae bacterium]|nr:TAXI family TRAP transporter solute-binding subunit [Steroidobacteraceae bacterium]
MRFVALLFLALLAGCARGPDEDVLASDVQARLDGVFGAPVAQVATLRRQGSAPYRAAADGSRQVIVYFNAVLRFTAAYDPSDWESLSPELIASALGATDQGIFGLGPGRHEAGAEFRSHGSLVYRKVDAGWVVSDERLPGPGAANAAATSGTPQADELVQRLSQLVMQSPATRGADREIITEEIDRALRNINLRLEREHEGVAVAAGPQGGEYWRFLTSILHGLPPQAGVRIVATEGSVANAFLIESHKARVGVMQSDVAAAAVTGQGIFAETGPMSHLRATASLFPEPVHVVVAANSGIASLADLAGRRVALGSPASGSRHTALRMLSQAGVDAAGLAYVFSGDPTDALGMLVAGELDAVIEVVAAPWQQLRAVAQDAPLRLVPLGREESARISEAVPGLVPLGIPARTYPGQTEVVPTVAATALLVAHSDVADATVEAMLALLYATAAERGGVLAARLSRERARTGITIPVHGGATRFFERPADGSMP